MAEDTGAGGDVTQPAYLSHGVRLDCRPITLALSRREGGTLSCAPSAVTDAGNGPPLMRRSSAVADAGNGRPLIYSLRSPSADAVAGGGQGSGIVQRQARPWPEHGDEATCLRQRDIGCAQTWAAKADVGRHGIRHGHVRDTTAIRGNHGNPAVVQRRDADIAGAVDGQRIKFLIAGDPNEE